MGANHLRDFFVGKQAEAKGDIHKERAAQKKLFHLLPHIPAAEMGSRQNEVRVCSKQRADFSWRGVVRGVKILNRPRNAGPRAGVTARMLPRLVSCACPEDEIVDIQDAV